MFHETGTELGTMAPTEAPARLGEHRAAEGCPLHALTSITLEESRACMRREAVKGVLDTGRYRCKYMVWGDGPPLVFIHGLGDEMHTFVMTMAALSREFTCIAYNQPTGRHDGARIRKYRHDDLVDDLFVLMDHLKLNRTMLFGSSFGSMLAMRAMCRQPKRFPLAVFQGAFAYRPIAPAERWLARIARFFPSRMGQLPLRKSALLRVHAPYFADCEADVFEFFLSQSGKAPVPAVAHWALVLDKMDVRELLPSIRQPVLLIAGDSDALVPRRHQEHLFTHLPNAAMFEIAGCGHLPMFTHPEALAGAVRRFVRGVGNKHQI